MNWIKKYLSKAVFASFTLALFLFLAACSNLQYIREQKPIAQTCDPQLVESFFKENVRKNILNRTILMDKYKLSKFFSSFKTCEYNFTFNEVFAYSPNGTVFTPYEVEINTKNETRLTGCISWTSERYTSSNRGKTCFMENENK